MEKDLYIAIGNQQKFNNKSYYTIKSLKTAKYLFLNNDVGIQRNGIYVEDLKALLQNPVCDMDVINLGINSNGNFYESLLNYYLMMEPILNTLHIIVRLNLLKNKKRE